MNGFALRLGLSAGLFLMACGDDGGSASDVDAGPAVAIDADTTPAIDAAPPLTGLAAYCAPGGSFEQLLATRGSCRVQGVRVAAAGTDLNEGEALGQFCQELFGPMVADPSVTFDDSKMQVCLDYLGATDCIEIPTNLNNTPCSDVFVGQVATDGDCDHDNQCAGDAYCEPRKGLCNSCQDRFVADTDCVFDSQCADGKCNSQGSCAAPVALNGGCDGDADCAGILICSPATDTCISPNPIPGDSCDGHDECTVGNATFGIGLFCLPSMMGGSGSCQQLPKVGETCGPMGPGNQPLCDFREYLWCDSTSNTCAAPSTSAPGGPCNALAMIGTGARQCEAGGICTNPLVEGGVAGTCLVAGYNGDSCNGEAQPTGCYPGYSCVDSLCVAPALITGMCPAP